ncbi:hypothetical protein [Lacrimispora amygdalina]|uniref:hypothetical protein n=1 Tax=Lacrimispora amygdalina TaxID=253257 RepID=UPI000BE2DFC3|nr:hypothetical protein [Lacrimispora amygdalina]
MVNNYEKVDASQNINVEMLQKYANRFGYLKKDRNNIKDFITKVNNRFDYLFKNYDDYDYAKKYVTCQIFQILGKQYYIDRDNSIYSRSDLHNLMLKLSEEQQLVPVLMICEIVISYLVKEENEELVWLTNAIAEDLLTSNINAALYKSPEGYEFYPATETLFDEALVYDVLNWLSEYPRTKEQYNKTLKMILHQADPRDLVDNLRLSLELFIKEFFCNEKSLENQKSLIGDYLTSHNVSKHFSNMYTTLFTHYTTYNNNEAKHNNTADEQEIDFLVYLTGSFIRFLIQLKRSEKKV